MNSLAAVLQRLSATIASRKHASPEESYVARLFAKGRKKIAQKIGEEGVEVAIAATRDKQIEIIKESADLLFHLLVLWEHAGVKPEDIAAEFESREGTSGIAEKKSRAL